MKKIFFLFALIISNNVLSENISDFQIEGISIGDSLLNYMSKQEIQNGIDDTKDMYSHLSDKFSEVYFYGNFNNYELLSFLVKPNDLKYIIHSIRGSIIYKNDINKCKMKLKEITNELSPVFINAEKDEGLYQAKFDNVGRTFITYVNFSLKNEGEIYIQCYDYSKEITKINNWEDNLSISIDTIEAYNWFLNPIN